MAAARSIPRATTSLCCASTSSVQSHGVPMKEIQAAASRRSDPAIRDALVGSRSDWAGFRLFVFALGLVAVAVGGSSSAFAQDAAAAQGGVPNVGRLGVELVSLAVVVAVVESA